MTSQSEAKGHYEVSLTTYQGEIITNASFPDHSGMRWVDPAAGYTLFIEYIPPPEEEDDRSEPS